MTTAPDNIDYITGAEFCAAYRAVAFANCQGFIMDTTLDVTWSLHGVMTEDAVAARQAELLWLIGGWLRKHDLPILSLWVLEVGATYGLHSHIVLHMPAQLETVFRDFVAAGLTHVLCVPLRDTEESTTFKLQTRGGEVTFAQWQRFRYMLKGIDPWAMALGNDRLHDQPLMKVADLDYRYQGAIGRHRIGISPEIDDVARQRWQAVVDLPDMEITVDTPPRYNDCFLHWHQQHVDRLRAIGLVPK
jgi:hypothetical protein